MTLAHDAHCTRRRIGSLVEQVDDTIAARIRHLSPRCTVSCLSRLPSPAKITATDEGYASTSEMLYSLIWLT
jgi:hypothetical protein